MRIIRSWWNDPTVYLVADTTDQGKDLYKWEYRKNLGKIGLGSGTFTLDGLDADKLYYLRLNAINSVGEHWTGGIQEFVCNPGNNDHLPMNLGLWLDATKRSGQWVRPGCRSDFKPMAR